MTETETSITASKKVIKTALYFCLFIFDQNKNDFIFTLICIKTKLLKSMTVDYLKMNVFIFRFKK
jgi:hypothetical protein